MEVSGQRIASAGSSPEKECWILLSRNFFYCVNCVMNKRIQNDVTM